MKTETVYTTSDKTRHNTLDDAKRHADKLYGEALSKFAHGICGLDWKYGSVMEHLDENLCDLIKLKALRDDAETWIDGEGDLRKWVEGKNGLRSGWSRNGS